MSMHQPFMAMPVRVRSMLHRHVILVFMLMMGIMSVPMIMRYDFVSMIMPVPLSQVQPKPEAHQDARYYQLSGYWFLQHHDRQNRTDKWR
jgi:hypothetical protein